jgi:hypothetical protein
LFQQKKNGNPLPSSKTVVQRVAWFFYFLFFILGLWNIHSPHFLSERTERRKEITGRTLFGEIGDDPNLSFDAMDTRIFVSVSRHYSMYVTNPTHKQVKKKTVPPPSLFYFLSLSHS